MYQNIMDEYPWLTEGICTKQLVLSKLQVRAILMVRNPEAVSANLDEPGRICFEEFSKLSVLDIT